MSRPASFRAVAWNPVPDSENRIHADDVARAYGFRGGLVPGVVVAAYLLHPAAMAWGAAFAARGRAHVRVDSPVYDGEAFRVEVSDAAERDYRARLVDARDVACATAEVSLPDAAPESPTRRGDRLLGSDEARPLATREALERARVSGLGALRARWNGESEIPAYLRDADAMAPVFADRGLAHPAFVLGLSNWVLAGNLRMPAWVHLETRSDFFGVVERGAEVVAEAAVADLFEKKGHAFVDLDVHVFGVRDDAPRAAIRLRAIYRLRDP